MAGEDPWFVVHLMLGVQRVAVPLQRPEVELYGGPTLATPVAAGLQLQAKLQALCDRLSHEEQQLLAAVLSQAAAGYGVVDEPGSLSAVMTTEGMVLRDADGMSYTIPQELLEQCQVAVGLRSDVS